MKKIIIYQSKYGTTERYAKSLAESLGCQCVRAADAQKLPLDEYGLIIFGGGLYGGGIDGVSLITGRWDELRDKRVIVFTVGIADPAGTDYSNAINRNFNEEQRQKIRIFHLRGGIDYKKLKLVHRAILAVLAGVLRRKKETELPAEAKVILDTYGKAADFVDTGTLRPIIDSVLQTENS